VIAAAIGYIGFLGERQRKALIRIKCLQLTLASDS
jgi:hypothetical protein